MQTFHDDFSPEEVIINGIEFESVYSPDQLLRKRREDLSLTQQQVADFAGIALRQYQRFESAERRISAASMRVGLSIRQVLRLDPYRFMPQSE